ncbi:hypothetical protein K445DRAFT_380642 [Daldinia sp. EC12]|nr:hypothetical protein K445DRAFT_380642 [Daldinia sp. EC12]
MYLSLINISNRLGRPPKGATKKHITTSKTKTKELPNQSRPFTAAAQRSLVSGQSQHESLISLDGILVNAFANSPYTASSPELIPPREYTSLDESETETRPPFVRDDQESWMALDQLQQSPMIRAQQLNAVTDGSQRISNDDTTLPCYQDSEYRSEPARCSCLQQNTRFLCHVKELDKAHSSHFIVITLDMANRCLQLWKSNMGCQLCWNDEDCGALQVLLISLSTVVKRVWTFLTYQEQKNVSTESPPPGGELELPRIGVTEGASISTEGEYSKGPNGANRGVQLQQNLKVPLIKAPPMKITVDEFQVPEEEQMFIIGMLIIRMLKRIKEGLEDLRNRINAHNTSERDAIQSNWHPLHSSVPLILGNLDKSVLELEQSLQNFIMP